MKLEDITVTVEKNMVDRVRRQKYKMISVRLKQPYPPLLRSWLSNKLRLNPPKQRKNVNNFQILN